MVKLKEFALKRPFLFGLLLIVVYSILSALSYPVHYLFPENELGQLYGDALGKFLIFLVMLFFLWRFGWLEASRISRFGRINVWLVIAPVMIYKVLSWLFSFTGDISIAFPDTGLALANLIFPFQTSLVEEIMFRGFVLTAMMIAWGNTKQGQFKAVVLSSAFFGLMHMFNLLVRPIGVVLSQALIATLPGILYAAIALRYKTLWPAIIIHWFTNAAINIKLIGIDSFQESLTDWGVAAAFMVPLLVLGFYWVWKLPDDYRSKNYDKTVLSSLPSFIPGRTVTI